MEKMVLRKIGFGTYIKIFLLSGFAVGVFIGVIILIVGLLGGPATATVGQIEFSGIVAGLLALLIAPLSSALVFLWFSIIMFPGFRLILKIFNGLKIKALIFMPSEYEEYEEDEEDEDNDDEEQADQR